MLYLCKEGGHKLYNNLAKDYEEYFIYFVFSTFN